MQSRIVLGACAASFLAACGSSSSSGPTAPSSSEVGVSVVSGAINNTSGSAVAFTMPRHKAKLADRVLDALNPIGTAYAADWACKGGSLSPAFAGPAGDPYAFTPLSCEVTWANGKTASSSWTGPFTLVYGSSCDAKHPFLEAQAAGCSITRTTGAAGVTRDITGPDGNGYAITHDTDGAGSGWDSSVSPAPTNGGVVGVCASAGCAAGRDYTINGSHLTGTVTIDGVADQIWDHTVSTGASGITVTGVGASRVVSGSVTVQHNLAKYTATVTFNDVGYGEVGCCFPTSGAVSTTFSKGPDVGKTETLSFSDVCGEATLTTADGVSAPLTLQHCL